LIHKDPVIIEPTALLDAFATTNKVVFKAYSVKEYEIVGIPPDVFKIPILKEFGEVPAQM
jgi:hypothetical protein